MSLFVMSHHIIYLWKSYICGMTSVVCVTEGCEYEAVIVLLENDLVAIDLASPGYPLFENPYAMDLHEPPVVSCLLYMWPTALPTLYPRCTLPVPSTRRTPLLIR